jgi:hypothetical protein
MFSFLASRFIWSISLYDKFSFIYLVHSLLPSQTHTALSFLMVFPTNTKSDLNNSVINYCSQLTLCSHVVFQLTLNEVRRQVTVINKCH